MEPTQRTEQEMKDKIRGELEYLTDGKTGYTQIGIAVDSIYSLLKEELGKAHDISNVNRVEIIGKGREYVNMNTGRVEISMQDGNRTMKIFVENGVKPLY